MKYPVFLLWPLAAALFAIAFAVGIQQGFAQDNPDDALLRLIDSHTEVKSDAGETLRFMDNPEVVIRFSEVELAEAFTKYGVLKQDEIFLLNLFDDVEYTARVRRTAQNINGTITLMAGVEEPGGYVILATTGKRSLGSVYIPSLHRYYRIISDPVTHLHYLIEMDSRDRDIIQSGPPLIPDLGEDDILEQEKIQKTLEEKDLGPDDMANIDVMVVYTSNARQWANISGGGIDNVIALAMENAQLTLDNSETLMMATLVYSAMVNYQESGDSGDDLRRLTASASFNPFGSDHSGYMNEVHLWRDHYGADLTAIFAHVSDVGGLGWLLTNRNGAPRFGFSLTRVQQAAGYTHIHEMGHNMGLHHHAEQNFQPGPTQWSNWPENNWSAGWRWTGEDGGHYCSVMTYTGGQYFSDGITHEQLPYFSNPLVNHMSVPAGHASKGDNARTLREIKHVIAAYRTSELPMVLTSEVVDVEPISATSGGTVLADGDSPVVARGVVWNRIGDPSLDDHEGMTQDGEGTGEFVSELTGLHPNTDYLVRAYATTGSGTRYGAPKLFKTGHAFLPSVTTVDASMITYNAATSGGTVTSDGNLPVIQRGVIWGRHSWPTLEAHEGLTKDGQGVGPFVSELTGLSSETTYYYRSYAINLLGVTYGLEDMLTTPAAMIYPNPAPHRLQVEFNNESDGDVYVFMTSLQGEMVKRRKITHTGDVQLVFDTSHLRPGIYLLSIRGEVKFPVWQIFVTR